MITVSSDKIFNIALAGHGGSGKTSLAEAIIYKAGQSERLGKVLDGNTICDFDAEEIKRKCTISSTVASFIYSDQKINLIDSPGLFDYAGGFYEAMRAAETVLVTVSGKSGLTVGAQNAFKAAAKNKKSRAIFISKLDSESASFEKVLDAFRIKYGNSVCPLVVPVMKETVVEGYIDILNKKAYTYDKTGNVSEFAPDGTDGIIEETVMQLSEIIAETDEKLMDKYFSGEQFTEEELKSGVKAAIRTNALIPVFCGSGITTAGVDLLLNGISTLFPTTKDVGGEIGEDAKGEKVTLDGGDAGPLAAIVFKTVADPFVGKMSFFKVVSGVLKADSEAYNIRLKKAEKIGKVFISKGKKTEETSAIGSGDIGFVSKLSDTITCDTLSSPAKPIKLDGIEFPAPCHSKGISVVNKNDESKISGAITRLCEEDLTLKTTNNVETHQVLLTGMGEQHLEVAVGRLKQKFGVETRLSDIIIPYRETIRKKVKVEGKHKKQTGGHGQYGHVWMEFEPCEGEDIVFEEKIFGGSVPRGYFPAVEKGLRDSVLRGTIAGYPVVGIKATLVDGSYHDVDSSEMAFKLAANLAFKAGIPQCSPVLLEPIGTLKVCIPDKNTGDMLGEINKKRGRVLGMEPVDDLTCVEAEVPMSEMSEFTNLLRAMAGGMGYFTLEFARYEPLPANLEAAVIAAAPKKNHAEEE